MPQKHHPHIAYSRTKANISQKEHTQYAISLTSIKVFFSRLQKNFVLTFYRVLSFCMKVVKLFVDTIWAHFIINDNNVPEDTKARQIQKITITIEFCFLHKQAQKINIICQITLNFRDLANYSLFLIKNSSDQYKYYH